MFRRTLCRWSARRQWTTLGVVPKWELSRVVVPSAQCQFERSMSRQRGAPSPLQQGESRDQEDTMEDFGWNLDRPHASKVPEALIEELQSAGRLKRIPLVTELVEEIHLRLLQTPHQSLGPNGGELMARLFAGLTSVPHLPLSLSFANAIVKGLAEYASTMTPEVAAECLGSLAVFDAIYHREVLQTLIIVIWTGLEDPDKTFSVDTMESIAEGLRLVEDLLTHAELRLFCKRLVKAVEANQINIGLCVSYLLRLKNNASYLLIGPEVEQAIVTHAPTLPVQQLLPCLALCLRFENQPYAVGTMIALIERFLRQVVREARTDGVVNLAFALEFMDAVKLRHDHPIATAWKEIYNKAVSEMEQCIRFQNPPKANVVTLPSAPGQPHTCTTCGSELPWPEVEAPYCMHSCDVIGVSPFPLDRHLQGVYSLCEAGFTPQQCDLTAALMVWLGNRLTTGVVDAMSHGQRALLTKLIAKLSDYDALLPSAGFLVPQPETPSPLGQSMRAYLSWQEAHAKRLSPDKPFIALGTVTRPDRRPVTMVRYRMLSEAVKLVRRGPLFDRSQPLRKRRPGA